MLDAAVQNDVVALLLPLLHKLSVTFVICVVAVRRREHHGVLPRLFRQSREVLCQCKYFRHTAGILHGPFTDGVVVGVNQNDVVAHARHFSGYVQCVPLLIDDVSAKAAAGAVPFVQVLQDVFPILTGHPKRRHGHKLVAEHIGDFRVVFMVVILIHEVVQDSDEPRCPAVQGAIVVVRPVVRRVYIVFFQRSVDFSFRINNFCLLVPIPEVRWMGRQKPDIAKHDLPAYFGAVKIFLSSIA